MRQSEEKFIKAFHASPLPISISTHAEGRFIDVNNAFLQMLDFTREQVIGYTAAELDFWAEPGGRARMLLHFAEGKEVKMMPARFRNSSGEYREGNVSAELIELDGVRCVLAIIQDLTETKRLEVQLRQAQKMEAIGQMVGGIAHDFNNMLSIIIGYSDLTLGNMAEPDLTEKNLSQIKKAATRAAAFVSQLLAFSKERALYSRVLDLNGVISGLNQMLGRMLGENIVLTFKPAAAPVYIDADLGQVEQVLMNLMLNARDAMLNGGEICVETSTLDVKQTCIARGGATVPPGRYVTLSVTDGGCGMDKQTLARMFEPFFTTKFTGTGLGLATVRDIVKRSKGHISIDSKPGGGTTFCLFFPRVEDPANACFQLSGEVLATGGTESILIVEDDESLRLMMVALLKDAGYKVFEAATPEQAADTFKAHSNEIDLLLTDSVMYHMSGLQLSRHLRSLRKDLKVVLMSGYDPGLIGRHGSLGTGIEFIEKPFTRTNLLGKIRLVLDARQQQHGTSAECHS